MLRRIHSLFSVWSGVLSAKHDWYPFELRKTDSRNAWLMSVCLSTILPRINTVYIYSNFIVNFVQCRFHLSIFITEVTLCFLWGYRLEDICKCFWSPPQLHRLSVAGLRRSPACAGNAQQLRWSLSGGRRRLYPFSRFKSPGHSIGQVNATLHQGGD